MSATSDRPAVIGDVPVAHTPGPWRVNGDAIPIICWSDTPNPIVDRVHGYDKAEAAANARLIAAAPDLLAFARAVRADASAYFLHRAADMVIAKAEGR